MKSTVAEVKKEVKNEVKKEELKEMFSLWINKGKSGKKYLTGKTSEELSGRKLVAFYNTNKKNPNEPDIRVYLVVADNKAGDEVASLWDHVSEKSGKHYLTGVGDEKEKLVGFYNTNKKNPNEPDFRVYEKVS